VTIGRALGGVTRQAPVPTTTHALGEGQDNALALDRLCATPTRLIDETTRQATVVTHELYPAGERHAVGDRDASGHRRAGQRAMGPR